MPERDSGWVTGTVDAEDARLATGILAFPGNGPLLSRSGVRPTSGAPGYVEVLTSSPGKVTVHPFQAVIQGNGPVTGAYLVSMDSPKVVDVLGGAPAHETLVRADRIVAVQTDTEYGDRGTALEIRHLVGTPSAQDPVLPEPTGAALVLADILVPPGTSALDQDDHLVDSRPFTAALGGIIPVLGTVERPQDPYPGQTVFRLDEGCAETCFWDGWAPITRGGIQWHYPDANQWPRKKTVTTSDAVTIDRVEVPAAPYSRALQVTGHAILVCSADSERFDLSLTARGTSLATVVITRSAASGYTTGTLTAVCTQDKDEALTIDLKARRSGSAGSATVGYSGEYTSLNVLAFPL